VSTSDSWLCRHRCLHVVFQSHQCLRVATATLPEHTQ
jgi:hypothetical protein